MKEKILNFLMLCSFILLIASILFMFNQNETEKLEKTIKQNFNSFKITINKEKIHISKGLQNKKAVQNKLKKDLSENNVVSVKVNEPEAFGGKTKNEIYSIRTSYVKQR